MIILGEDLIITNFFLSFVKLFYSPFLLRSDPIRPNILLFPTISLSNGWLIPALFDHGQVVQ